MRILFWNTNCNKNINKYIANIVDDQDIDLLILVEYAADAKGLENLFTNMELEIKPCNTYGCDKISIWSDYLNVKEGIQQPRYSIQIINDEWILCSVHLISNLHGDYNPERLEMIQDIMFDVNETAKAVGSQKIIIIGDMNEMPYDLGCLGANGFHGLPALSISDDEFRTVNGKSYKKFYNPMWNLLGDDIYPPGTYFYNNSRLSSPIWYMFDQVIISKEVIPLFQKKSLKIITSCSLYDLRNKHNHPDKKISDHFPIMCEIKDR